MALANHIEDPVFVALLKSIDIFESFKSDNYQEPLSGIVGRVSHVPDDCTVSLMKQLLMELGSEIAQPSGKKSEEEEDGPQEVPD